VTFAKSVRFPMLPVTVGRKKADSKIVNGVVLSPELAQQVEAHLARQRQSAGAA
jgi:hypothetical protein